MYFRIFSSKSVIMFVLCLDLEICFHQFLLGVFKMNDTVNFEGNFFVNFIVYQTIIFHSKSIIPIVLCLVFTNSLFSTIFTQWFKGKLFR